jgi:septal ring factor EnvC (AmiA/AmiB activator)
MPLSRPILCLAALLALAGGGLAVAQQRYGPTDIDETRNALAEARVQAAAAQARGERLEAEAARVIEAAERTAQQSAAVAARIQQAEAETAAHQARIELIAQQRAQVGARLAEKQRPLVELTAALQRLSRRPLIFALLRPGSVEDTMHLRAMLATMLPVVERRTAALRDELSRYRVLQRQAEQAAADLRATQRELTARRRTLAGIETRQRLAARDAAGVADRESENALALAEQARDLGSLVGELGRAGALRDELAGLQGPVPRPAEPERAIVKIVPPSETPQSAPARYVLPVDGRLVHGFAADGARGIEIAARSGAQAVAPGAGRVAFAGPYRGYGRIVIVEHPGGWTSLVTGLAQTDVRVGQQLVAGSPLGRAPPGRPVVTLELRRDGDPVNPLDYLRS